MKFHQQRVWLMIAMAVTGTACNESFSGMPSTSFRTQQVATAGVGAKPDLQDGTQRQNLTRGPIAFDEGTLPASGKTDAWTFIGQAGSLRLNDREQLVLAHHPGAIGNDHRIAATIDPGLPNCTSFVIDFAVDPASNSKERGLDQLDVGLTIGLPNLNTNPNRFGTSHTGLSLNIRDLSDRGDFGVFWKGQNLSLPVPANRGTGNPTAFQRHDGLYRFRMIVSPGKTGSSIRVYHTWFVTPVWEGVIPQRLTPGIIGIYSRIGRHDGKRAESVISSLSIRKIAPEVATRDLSDAEHVLYSLNLDYPGLEPVKSAIERADIEMATSLFVSYLRNRTNVTGPSVSNEPLTQKEQRIADLMTEDKIQVYTGGPLFEHDFGQNYDWSVDPYDTGGQFAIYNSRMFPWIYMGRAWKATGKKKYERTFVKQLNSWLDQIPLKIAVKAGGDPFFIDGNSLEPPLLFTGNLGRRIELTWWQAFELFKSSEDFDDASVMRMMRYFQENARLVTNPSIFLAWDDSGLHMATGLLQCATMMPEWREAKRWESIAFDRLEETFRSQVHPDGTHASLSTGYGWATIDSYRNVFRIMQRNKKDVPPRFKNAIRSIVIGYMSLLRPDYGNINLNDGGWSRIDDKVRDLLPLFPNDSELEWFASNGHSGKRPDWTSRYFPNAGWYVMRTGFGPNEKMLFMDGGPFGASHGKQDALHLIVALGGNLLLRDGGRGDYTGKPESKWTGETHAFNTLTPDDAVQNRIYRYEHEKHIGFHPPKRPWISNSDFDYGMSSYNAGWFQPGQSIQGEHTRQVLFLKGQNPPATGYWIVIDQVIPADGTEREWKHPWHLSTESVAIDRATGSFTTTSPGANLRVTPVDSGAETSVQIVKGQREPFLQGWRVYGSVSRPFNVPVHSWKASTAFQRAWVLECRPSAENAFPIVSATEMKQEGNQLSFTLHRSDGGRDVISFPRVKQKNGDAVSSSAPDNRRLTVLRHGKDGKVEARLVVNEKAQNGEAPE